MTGGYDEHILWQPHAHYKLSQNMCIRSQIIELIPISIYNSQKTSSKKKIINLLKLVMLIINEETKGITLN